MKAQIAEPSVACVDSSLSEKRCDCDVQYHVLSSKGVNGKNVN